VDVAVVREGSTVTIDVVDDGRGSVDSGGSAAAAADSAGSVGSGRGLSGMLERARIYAGTVEAGRSADRGWRVHAVLHWHGDNESEGT
jgi:signal transduction histidine kinase